MKYSTLYYRTQVVNPINPENKILLQTANVSREDIAAPWLRFCGAVNVCVCLRGVGGRIPVFQPGGLGSYPGRDRNFNFCPGTGCECPLTVFCPVLSLMVALTLYWPEIQGGPPLRVCLVLWSTVSSSPYRHSTHGHLDSKSQRMLDLHWEKANNREKIINVCRLNSVEAARIAHNPNLIRLEN